jgi:UPF0271 protein
LNSVDKNIVIDTNCILAGFQFDGTKTYFTSPLALDEIERGKKREELDDLVERGVLVVKPPSLDSIERINVGAQETGDINRLSRADMELLALANDMEAVIISDDYSIQNLASRLGIEYEKFGKASIRKEIDWTYRCKGCGRYYEKEQMDCPVCGSEVVMKEKRV